MLTTYRDACVGKMNTTIVPEAITSASLLQMRDITASSSVSGNDDGNVCQLHEKRERAGRSYESNGVSEAMVGMVAVVVTFEFGSLTSGGRMNDWRVFLALNP